MILEFGQKIEDFIKHLNSGWERELEYEVFLYDSGVLVFPGTEESGQWYKLCSLKPRQVPEFYSPAYGTAKFWDGMPDIDPLQVQKIVLFTFEAVRLAIEAFQCSFQ